LRLCLGDVITIDGNTGTVYRGALDLVNARKQESFDTVMGWAAQFKCIKVTAIAENCDDVLLAVKSGVEGIGELRTEHMFLSEKSIALFRRIILFAADTPSDHTESEQNNVKQHGINKCFRELLRLQQAEFTVLLRNAGNRSVHVRLLNKPIEEFFPSPRNSSFEQEMATLALRMSLPVEDCTRCVLALQEASLALGFRGARLSLVHPVITELQVRAIVGKK
jgi:pyruvate, orthophosphate dikinase